MGKLPPALADWEVRKGQDPREWPGQRATLRVQERAKPRSTEQIRNADKAKGVMDEADPEFDAITDKTDSMRATEIPNDKNATEPDKNNAETINNETKARMDEKRHKARMKTLATDCAAAVQEAKTEVQQEDEKRNELRRCYVGKSFTLTNSQRTTKRRDWFETEPLSAWAVDNIVSLQLVTYSQGGLSPPDEEKGSWSWFELSIRGGNDRGTPRKLSGGQSLAWLSHGNTYNDDTVRLHRGRVFTKEDGFFKHLKPKDRISVSSASCLGHSNVAQNGYLLLGFDKRDVGVHQRLRFATTENGTQDDEPAYPNILVCGQERRDCFMVSNQGPSSTAKVTMVDGGVRLMRRLLEDTNWSVFSSPSGPTAPHAPAPLGFHSILTLAKDQAAENKGGKNPPLKVGKQTAVTAGPTMTHNWENPKNATPRIVVWDDYEVSEANRSDYIYTLNDHKAKVLLYQMHAPLCQGVLWENFRPSNKHSADGTNLPKVLVVIDMDDLRAQGFNISRGISWEKTMEDFRANIGEILDKLELPWYMHLIVRCGYEAAIYVRERRQVDPNPQPTIDFVTYMVPNMAEGHVLGPHNGWIPGIDIAFATGLAASLVKESDSALDNLQVVTVGQAIEAAICRSHRFAFFGFRPNAAGVIDYPNVQDVTNVEINKPRIIYADSQFFQNSEDGEWSLFNLAEIWKDDIAAETVKTGTKLIETCVPTAQYGPLKTADRAEIEGFRSAEAVIKQYIVGNVRKPLSIAVFGQPGSGKSFGVKKVIEAVLRDSKLKPIEANLSQFVEYRDLVGIFDSVRDMSLKGNDIPVVLFDEFDSEFDGKPLGWLKYFLAPMQDNQYLDNGAIRLLGRAIFVFIGGTSSTFEDFSQGGGHGTRSQHDVEQARVEKAEKQAKKPDFISRLSAHINVAGPNPHGKDNQGDKSDKSNNNDNKNNESNESDNDKMVIMRRAILLRSLLETRLGTKNAIQVDETLLMALLEHPKFPHGSRSLELILQSSRVSSGQKLQPSALPPDSQLAMHLDLRSYKEAMGKRLEEPEFRPFDVRLYNKLRWAASAAGS